MAKAKMTGAAHPSETIRANDALQASVRDQPVEQEPQKGSKSKKVKLSRRERLEMYHPWVLHIKPTEEESRWIRATYWMFVFLRMYRWPDFFQPRTYSRSRKHVGKIRVAVAAVRKFSQGVITVTVGKGGASKTTVATFVAAILNFCHGMNTWLCDIDPNGSRATRRFALIDVPTLTTNEITQWVMSKSRLGKVLLTSQWFIDHLATDELSNNLFVSQSAVVEDDLLSSQMISAEAMETTIEASRPAMHTIVADCGPSVGHGVSHGAINSSEVRIIVSLGDAEEAISDIATALNNHKWNLRSKEREESVLVVVSGLPRRRCNLRTQYRLAAQLDIAPHKVKFIPNDRYLRQKGRVNQRKLQTPTLNSMYDVVQEVTDIIVAANKRKEVPDAESSINIVMQPAHDQTINSHE